MKQITILLAGDLEEVGEAENGRQASPWSNNLIPPWC